MPGQKKKSNNAAASKKAAWKTESYNGAFLFLLFEQKLENPDDFSASEVQNNPLYPFEKYSSANFKRNSQTVANKVIRFKKYGTGLTEAFKCCMKEVIDSNHPVFEGIDEEDYDEDYTPSDDEDMELASFDDEVSLSDNVLDPRFDWSPDPQPPISVTNVLDSTNRNKKRKQSDVVTGSAPASKVSKIEKTQNNIRCKKYLARMANGRYIGVYKLDTGFDDNNNAFRIDDTKKKIILRQKLKPTIPNPMNNSKDILKRHMLDDGNANIIGLQATIDKTVDKGFLLEFRDKTIFDTPAECEPQFVDHSGTAIHEVFFSNDDDGTEWVYFWLNEKAKKEDACQTATANRPIARPYTDLKKLTQKFNEDQKAAARDKEDLKAKMEELQAAMDKMARSV